MDRQCDSNEEDKDCDTNNLLEQRWISCRKEQSERKLFVRQCRLWGPLRRARDARYISSAVRTLRSWFRFHCR